MIYNESVLTIAHPKLRWAVKIIAGRFRLINGLNVALGFYPEDKEKGTLNRIKIGVQKMSRDVKNYTDFTNPMISDVVKAVISEKPEYSWQDSTLSLKSEVQTPISKEPAKKLSDIIPKKSAAGEFKSAGKINDGKSTK